MAASVVNVERFRPYALDSERETIARRIVNHGHWVSERASTPDEADPRQHPLRYLLGVLFNQGIPWEQAWRAPRVLEDRLTANGSAPMTAEVLASIELETLEAAIRDPPALHRFPRTMAKWVQDAAVRVKTCYHGDAARLWAPDPGALEVISRFDEFNGIGQKKSAMAVNMLVRDYGVQISGWADIDVSYDVHVRRVFLRTGLAQEDTVEAIVSAARTLLPKYPGNLDLGAWDIGKNWCRPSNPDCETCPLASDCRRNLSVDVPRA
jgi:uncharacterized HhH-GPD family protein